MRDVIIAYIMGANENQLKDLAEHITTRQTTLSQKKALNLKLFGGENI